MFVLLPTKPSSDDDSGLRHGFGTEASIPLAQSAPSDFVGLSSLNEIAISTLMQLEPYLGSYFMYFLFSDDESPRLVKNTAGELVMKPRYLTSIRNILFIQPFLTHCSRKSSYFSNLR